MSETRQTRGQWAETLALEHLRGRGLVLEARNYRSRRGEIDLIMGEGRTLVFVEVRFRAATAFGQAVETVDRRKQARIVATAQTYLQDRPGDANRPCRFDVVSITGDSGSDAIDWIQDAFQA